MTTDNPTPEAVDLAAVKAARSERTLRMLEEAIAAIEHGNLYETMCCSGLDCGCRGSSYADLLVHDLRAVLAEYVVGAPTIKVEKT